MNNKEKDDLFYNFVKNHPKLANLSFGLPIEGQQWIGIMGNDEFENIDWFKKNDGVYILSDWIEIYNDFINSIDQSNETIDYISNKISKIDTNEKLADFVITHILERLKFDNIQSDKIYVSISNNWDKTWFNSIEEN